MAAIEMSSSKSSGPSTSAAARRPATVLAVVIVTVGAGCGDSSTAPSNATEARSTAARVTAPAVSVADSAQLAADNRAFAVALHAVLRDQPGNLVYAPASISIALAMLYGGAAGTTATEMAAAMHFALPPERLHPAFDALDLALAAPPADGTAFRLSLANAAWGQRGHSFLAPYLDLLAENYGAGLRLVDFAASEAARAEINQWVSDETEHLIEDLLPAGAIKANTRLVLTNAVHFKADWQMPFAPQSAPAVFHTTDGDVSVPMMRGPDSVPIWTGDGFAAAALPYAGGTASMVVLVPDAGTFATFEAGFTADRLAAILDAQDAAVLGVISLPRFKFTTRTDLVQALQTLGMNQAFVAGLADLSSLDGTRELFVADVLHQATIAVDEKGTEAAAATAVIVSRKAVPLASLTVDRPFLFFIRDNATGAILFQGRVLDPTQ